MDKLKETASNKDREEIKNRAVEVRESGDLAQAKELLEQVIDWDEKNDNPRGEIDALGHLRIVYSNMAEEEKDAQVKQSLKEQARGCVEKALVIIDARPEIPQDSRSILQVHLASTIFETAKENTDPTFKVAQLEKALQVVKDAMETLPGSQAHKAWPANLKAKILYEMGKKEEAWDVLMQAEKWIYGGYNQEIVNGDQAEIKLNVWLSGLMLTKAEICKREGKTILARHYTEYIVSMNDSTNSLSQRKKDAQIILQSI
ncbi:hypothetical protein COT50_03650 [candidate division WWE3 bacterium CG08_land_8_20_14_0_20_41_10]|uniref:MalT-like TPR region domain-containing protein n=1 Tax=candidate division WWE3 bacterium CG08_land_8_20_14_0_20_41_10 TaxID=1975085 RepID=A0A2H0XDC3_UNCKA|nr:MAG: hypothetical protein COT50_03650 [candidate division WWE3 bacterium CG08_land_8_20_14_0_20_41_10]